MRTKSERSVDLAAAAAAASASAISVYYYHSKMMTMTCSDSERQSESCLFVLNRDCFLCMQFLFGCIDEFRV